MAAFDRLPDKSGVIQAFRVLPLPFRHDGPLPVFDIWRSRDDDADSCTAMIGRERQAADSGGKNRRVPIWPLDNCLPLAMLP